MTAHLPVEPIKCTGCGRCVAACPKHLFSLEAIGFRKTAVKVNAEHCFYCGRCKEICPTKAIVA